MRQNIEAGLSSFRDNPLRSSLTITGIVVGISALVAVLSIGRGNQAQIEAEVDKMGASLFWVEPSTDFSIGRIGPSAPHSYSNASSPVTLEGADLIEKLCPLVSHVAPTTSFLVQGTLNGKSVSVSVTGTTPEYQTVKSLGLIEGRYLCDLDLITMNSVCVIEETTQMSITSKDRNDLTINGTSFRIVGIIKRENSRFTGLNSIFIHVPLVRQASLDSLAR